MSRSIQKLERVKKEYRNCDASTASPPPPPMCARGRPCKQDASTMWKQLMPTIVSERTYQKETRKKGLVDTSNTNLCLHIANVRDIIIKFCKCKNAILGAQTMKIFYTIPWTKVVVPVATVKSILKCLIPSGSWKESKKEHWNCDASTASPPRWCVTLDDLPSKMQAQCENS